jgi:hypothetical protein
MSKELKNLIFIEMINRFEYDDFNGMMEFVMLYKNFLANYYRLINKQDV